MSGILEVEISGAGEEAGGEERDETYERSKNEWLSCSRRRRACEKHGVFPIQDESDLFEHVASTAWQGYQGWYDEQCGIRVGTSHDLTILFSKPSNSPWQFQLHLKTTYGSLSRPVVSSQFRSQRSCEGEIKEIRLNVEMKLEVLDDDGVTRDVTKNYEGPPNKIFNLGKERMMYLDEDEEKLFKVKIKSIEDLSDYLIDFGGGDRQWKKRKEIKNPSLKKRFIKLEDRKIVLSAKRIRIQRQL
ncbi:hypothetical protein GCK72_025845 [Caenorhabditis remanei]|uniref:Uncharacterized protein n=1 Tax=Caenorhabditis remanei TaxID=31234 RepID=A0A6A5G370_CAERE|nr:hypothetical protein GCK72_025845 [Caenorhabditis remanei]KAF1749377.1 hypothetical protein GCK72_025845 [Caenorhabditis remanei]